jgi:anti-sigma regulatory factor (Ser/Thr protein kinase)
VAGNKGNANQNIIEISAIKQRKQMLVRIWGKGVPYTLLNVN